MCNRHENYKPPYLHTVPYYETDGDTDNYQYRNAGTFLDDHIYKAYFRDQPAINELVKEKIAELNEKRAERSDRIVHEKVKCENLSNELYWELVDDIEADDLICTQYNAGVEELESYLRWNQYHDGRKNSRVISIDEGTNKVKCKCGHTMFLHNGEFNEGYCGAGCSKDCKKLEISDANRLKFAKLSGTTVEDELLNLNKPELVTNRFRMHKYKIPETPELEELDDPLDDEPDEDIEDEPLEVEDDTGDKMKSTLESFL